MCVCVCHMCVWCVQSVRYVCGVCVWSDVCLCMCDCGMVYMVCGCVCGTCVCDMCDLCLLWGVCVCVSTPACAPSTGSAHQCRALMLKVKMDLYI